MAGHLAFAACALLLVTGTGAEGRKKAVLNGPSDPKEGSAVWKAEFTSAVNTVPALSHDGKLLYYGAGDNGLYAVDSSTGQTVWSKGTGVDVDSSPELSPGMLPSLFPFNTERQGVDA